MGNGFAKIAVYGFSLAFSAIGLALIYGAIVTYQNGETTNALLMLVAALAFGGVGAGVFALFRTGFRQEAQGDNLRAVYPDEPWKWREDWSNGRIRSGGKATAWFFWGFGILWSLISTPLLFFLPEEILDKGNYAALLGFLFPLVGIILLIVAARKTIQVRKYGDVEFIMKKVPGVLGGEVAGTIVLPRGLTGAATLSVHLSCIRRERQRSGKNTSTNETVVWQTEATVVGLIPTGEGTAQGALVAFRVPYDASPTEQIDADNSILWRLEAGAAVPGVDFAASFEIPVFKTRDSSSTITEEQLRSEEVREETSAAGFVAHPDVDVLPSTGGGTEFVLKPRGGKSGVLSGIIGALVFVGIAVLLAYAGAPIIFPLVFVAFGLFIAFMLVFSMFGESRIVVEGGHTSVRNSLFGIMSGKRIPCSSITKISVKGNVQSQKGGYYSVVFTQADGKSASPIQFLRDNGEADWLAEEVRKAMVPWRDGSRRKEETIAT